MEPKDFFSPDQCNELEKLIADAESKTSGELRIHVERICEDPVARAKEVFAELKMHETEQKSGVLFYLAIESRRFSILGDEGINKLVPENFWDSIRDGMAEKFKEGHFVEGMKFAIEAAGEQLSRYFPINPSDRNELSNTISFGTH